MVCGRGRLKQHRALPEVVQLPFGARAAALDFLQGVGQRQGPALTASQAIGQNQLAADDAARQRLVIGGEAELRRAICDILTADPRSNYRRDKCRDRLYYFSVDNANVTCWFDFDFEAAEEKTEIVEVLKIEFKPVRRDE